MIPNEAIEAAHKAWREQAATDGSIFEYNLRAAVEAAAPRLMAQALDDAAAELDGKRLLTKPFHEYYPEWLRTRADEMRTK